MTDTKFTPGPWRRGQAGNLRIYGPDGMGEHSGVVAEVKTKNGHQTANAHLIAAAPDLYEALELVSSVLDEITESRRVISELEMKDAMKVDCSLHSARNALAKARGDHSPSG